MAEDDDIGCWGLWSDAEGWAAAVTTRFSHSRVCAKTGAPAWVGSARDASAAARGDWRAVRFTPGGNMSSTRTFAEMLLHQGNAYAVVNASGRWVPAIDVESTVRGGRVHDDEGVYMVGVFTEATALQVARAVEGRRAVHISTFADLLMGEMSRAFKDAIVEGQHASRSYALAGVVNDPPPVPGHYAEVVFASGTLPVVSFDARLQKVAAQRHQVQMPGESDDIFRRRLALLAALFETDPELREILDEAVDPGTPPEHAFEVVMPKAWARAGVEGTPEHDALLRAESRCQVMLDNLMRQEHVLSVRGRRY